MNKFEKLITSQTGAKRGANGEYLIRCPFHNDSNPSMGVNVLKGVFLCYGCGAKGNAVKLAHELKRGLSWKEASEYFDPEDVGVELHPEVKLPGEFRSFFPQKNLGREGLRAWAYMRAERNLPATLVYEFRMGFCVSGKYAHRVIVPVYTNNKLCSFVARDYTGKAEKKVLYPVGGLAASALFGYDRAVALNSSVVVITEGWADALAVLKMCSSSLTFGKWGAVALGTNRLSSVQTELLRRFKQFVVLLDNDKEGRAGTTQVRSMLSLVGNVSVASLRTAKDPGDASTDELVVALHNAASELMLETVV